MLMDGLIALVSGMGFVFLVLILISIIISLFQYIQKKEDTTKTSQEVNIIESKPSNEGEDLNDLELVAVIAGVIAASLNTTTDKLKVRSLRRIKSKKW